MWKIMLKFPIECIFFAIFSNDEIVESRHAYFQTFLVYNSNSEIIISAHKVRVILS